MVKDEKLMIENSMKIKNLNFAISYELWTKLTEEAEKRGMYLKRLIIEKLGK